MKKVICLFLTTLFVYFAAFINITNAETESKNLNISVTLSSITCVTNNHVGNEWRFSCTVNKISLKEKNTVKVRATTNNSISIIATAVEEDKYPDSNSKSLSIPVSKLKEGSNQYSIQVTVKENRGRYSGNTATWKFSFTVKKASALETGTISEISDDKIRNGNDKYTWSDGSKYEGLWKNNKLNGKGTLIYSNGDKYIGNFVNNKKSGSGAYTWENGDSYSGNWSNDKMSGSGVYNFKNGDKYSGKWDAGYMNGEGTYTFKNGTKLTGIWVDNQYSSED